MDKGIDKAISKYVGLARKKYPNIEFVYLFGSYVKGNATDNSDIDLALIFKKLEDKNRFNVQVQLMLIASKVDIRTEPHPLSSKDFESWQPLAVEIKKTGVEMSQVKNH